MNNRVYHNDFPERTARFALPSVSAMVLLAFLVLVSTVTAHELKSDFSMTAPSKEEIAAANAETLLDDIEGRFTRAFQDRMIGKNLVLAIFLTDYSSGNSLYETDPWLAEEVETQAKELARRAIYQALAETVNDVQVLYRMKEYGNNMTTAQLAVKDGDLDFQGPSLNRSGAAERNVSPPSFSSRLKLEADFDLGLSWRTTFNRFEYRATYFLVSEDIMGMSLESRMNDWSKIGLSYRMGPDESQAIATLSFALP